MSFEAAVLSSGLLLVKYCKHSYTGNTQTFAGLFSADRLIYDLSQHPCPAAAGLFLIGLQERELMAGITNPQQPLPLYLTATHKGRNK